jgi:hypothetical protein
MDCGVLNYGETSTSQFLYGAPMPFKRDLAFQNTPLSKPSFNTQPQIENEDNVT